MITVEAIVCFLAAVLTLGLTAEPIVNCPVPVSPQNGQIKLLASGGVVQFACDPGYILIGARFLSCIDGKWIPDPPECKSMKEGRRFCSQGMGGCSQRCMQYRNGNVHCLCHPGYKLALDEKTCLDMDECADEKLHRCQQKCINTIGSYLCSCEEGFRVVDKYHCKGCSENSYLDNELCKECPINSYIDGDRKNSLADCQCLPGFRGDPSNDVPCKDINECRENVLRCSGDCVNLPGSAICTCPTGYSLSIEDSSSCLDINECFLKNGGCEGTCVNSDGGFNCTCPQGYRIMDFFFCKDINECAVDNGGCEQKCNNFNGGYFCSCHEGYKPEFDQKSCKPASCPRPPTPKNSMFKCFKKGDKREALNAMAPIEDSFPFETTCVFNCLRGYKRAGDKSIECLINGTWSGRLLECRALQCPPIIPPANGDIEPKSCKIGSVDVHQKCYFTCLPGYRLKGKFMKFECQTNKTWKPQNFPKCQKIISTPHIKCPEDILLELPIGSTSAKAIIRTPTSNMDNFTLQWQPSAIKLDTEMEFFVGITEIMFTVPHSTRNKSIATCNMTVAIIDSEVPKVVFCPESFNASENDNIVVDVSWEKPVFTDNVGVIHVTQHPETNSTLGPGSHIVTYTAFDSSGNAASCAFVVTISSVECGFPTDPANGNLNCHDWTLGRICEPICDTGFVLFPQDQYVFVCDYTGAWSPSNKVPDCTPYVTSLNSSCSDGFELQNHIFTGELICVLCPSNYTWSERSRMCTPNNKDELGVKQLA